MMSVAATAEERSTKLTIPARADYLVLTRLALAAICRLTPLRADEVADLKLAATEAAADFVVDVDEPEPDDCLEMSATLLEDELVIELAGSRLEVAESERELGRAIIDATVDDSSFSPDRTRLTKRLATASV
jgi:anti-sigma regulatory factor (Ser/Thr protein kinase)